MLKYLHFSINFVFRRALERFLRVSNVDSEGEKEEHCGCSAPPASHGHGGVTGARVRTLHYCSG